METPVLAPRLRFTIQEQAAEFERSVFDNAACASQGILGRNVTVGWTMVAGQRMTAVSANAVPEDAEARAAQSQGRFDVAAELWDAAIARAGPNAERLAARANALRMLGRFDAAEPLLRELLERFPGHRRGLEGLAWLAQSRREWRRAILLWNLCLKKFADAPPQWSFARANALMGLGKFGEAESALRSLCERHPDNERFARQWFRARTELARNDGGLEKRRDALLAEAAKQFPEATDTSVLIQSIRIFFALGDYDTARARLFTALELATAKDDLASLILEVAKLLESVPRTLAYARLLDIARS